MSVSDPTVPGLRGTSRYFPNSTGEAALHIVVAFALMALSIASFVVSTMFGIAATFVLTLVLCVMLPTSMPVLIVVSFMFQNAVIASFTPLVLNDEAFDSIRGVNFVILVTAYGAFLLASFQDRLARVPELRPLLRAAFVLLGIIGFYFALGSAHGNPRDAVVYFRNTLTPLACFHVAVVAASLYRIDLRKSLIWLGAAAIAYGYCELFFTLDFLGLFNGDLYVQRQLARQIDTGAFEKVLQETGYVILNMQDMLTTTFFNTPIFKDILPRIYRIAGPNFHQISYAYALCTISVWLLFRRNWILALFALPLLLVVGSKGATAMLVFGLLFKLAARVVGPRFALNLVLVGAVVWIAAAVVVGSGSGDYHVLGFLAGLHGFAGNPLGQGLGIGGNLSSGFDTVNWEQAQASGAASVPVESAVGVMLYQMGIGAFAFMGFIAALAIVCRRLFLKTGDQVFAFGFIALVTTSANAVLQEEAYFSPLALGFSLLLVGVSLGTYWRTRGLTGSDATPHPAVEHDLPATVTP
ncbi:MAG: hypothetical protein P4M09_15655 [Devosia sp.]|nr:hypothetical protein [Devosia sp.]